MKIKHGYQCDVFVPEYNLVIECDGNYWHNYPHGQELDHTRVSELEVAGYDVLRLWESDINNMTLQQFSNLLQYS